MSRSHDSMYAVAALLEKAGVTVHPGRARHRADRLEWRDDGDTAVFPTVEPAWPTTDVDRDDVAGPAHDDAMTLDELAARCLKHGAEVQRVEGRASNGECEFCEYDTHFPAEITVYSSAPLPGAERDMSEMCRECAPTTVAALRGRFGLDVLVEIPAVTA